MDKTTPPARVEQLSVADLKAWRDRHDPMTLVDVRTPGEREIASIDGSRLLDQAFHDELMTMDRDAPLVFQCHHGMRSQAAAEYFLQAGFRRVYNLSGGIEAWSREVDAGVTRY
jgi:monothiol glutaredoxin